MGDPRKPDEQPATPGAYQTPELDPNTGAPLDTRFQRDNSQQAQDKENAAQQRHKSEEAKRQEQAQSQRQRNEDEKDEDDDRGSKKRR